MYKQILVAYDGSEHSAKALDAAIQSAKENAAVSLHVLVVMKYPTLAIGEAYVPATATVNDSIYRYSQDIAKQASDKLSLLPNVCTVETVEGDPGDCILEYARSHGCDLIMMGSRGYSGIKEFVLGSVSHYLVQHSPISVLVVK